MALPVVEYFYGFPVLDPTDFFYAALYDGVFQQPAPNRIALTTPAGPVVFKGEFTVSGGIVTSGTVDGFNVFAGDTKVMKGSGFDIPATELIDAIEAWQASDFEPLDELLFALPVKLIGSEQDDFIVASGEGSVALGRRGNDELEAIAEGVILKGGKGDDFLLAGSSRCSGGAGNDVFAFIDTAMPNRITDFSVDDDLFQLNPLIFEGVPFGFLHDDQFKVGKQASTQEQIVLYQQKRGNLWYDQDGSGSTFDPVKFAKVGKGLDLTAQHFYGEACGCLA